MRRRQHIKRYRGAGSIESDGETVAAVWYDFSVEENEEEINGTWHKVGFYHLPGTIQVRGEPGPFHRLMGKTDPHLVIDDGTSIPILIPSNGMTFEFLPGECDLHALGILPPRGNENIPQ